MKGPFLACALAVLAWQGGSGKPDTQLAQQQPQPDDPPSRVARLAFVSGAVSFQASGSSVWRLATLNYPATSGDRLFVDVGAFAELDAGWMTVRLAGETDITVSTLDDRFSQFALSTGSLRVRVTRLLPSDSVEVDTPGATIAIVAPSNVRIDALANDAGTRVRVDSGTVEIIGRGVSRIVTAGRTVRINGIDPIQLTDEGTMPPDALDTFGAARDSRAANPAVCRYVSHDIPGCADLDEHGRWENDAVLGPVWYPLGIPLAWAGKLPRQVDAA